jgi:hypothetical protein
MVRENVTENVGKCGKIREKIKYLGIIYGVNTTI